MGTIHTNFRISTAEAGARNQLAPLTTWKDRTALLGLALVTLALCLLVILAWDGCLWKEAKV